MSCTIEERNRARGVIQELGKRSDVIGTDLIAPARDPSGRWTIEIALDTDGLPAAVVMILGEAEMTIWDVGPRQSWWHCTAVV